MKSEAYVCVGNYKQLSVVITFTTIHSYCNAHASFRGAFILCEHFTDAMIP